MTDPSDEYLPFDKRITRPWVCKAGSEECERMKPCLSCRNRRNRRSGKKKQNAAKHALGVPNAKFRGTDANEEKWGGPFRAEVKSGQQVSALWTRFLDAEKQSDANGAVGDNRPFVFVAMPKGTPDGLVAVRLSAWREWIVPLLGEVQ